NDPVTLNFTRAINIGEYNLTILANASAQTYTIKNIRYIITEEGVSYDYSQVTGGRSVRYGDNYYTVTTEEPAPGILIDQTTAAIVSVGGFLIIFTAFLAARELRKREILKTERIFGK
ncbi:MAG: hypothetical protein KAU10_03185, partial [Dehalococcoidia bacterium]|nr:hypothetical protein [Dehalococcoidia bacterium]